MSEPRAAIVVPAGVSAEAVEKLRAANPDLFLVVSDAEPAAPGAPEPTANRHVWLTVISIVRGLLAAGKTTALFTGPAAPFAAMAAGALNMGLNSAEQAILGNPEVEDWPLSRIAAARAAVKDPTS